MTRPSRITGIRLSAAETAKRRIVALGCEVISIQVVSVSPDLKALISEFPRNAAPASFSSLRQVDSGGPSGGTDGVEGAPTGHPTSRDRAGTGQGLRAGAARQRPHLHGR